MNSTEPIRTQIELFDWESIPVGTRELRRAVFVGEQKVPEEIELDERDRHALHVVARLETGEVIGCARFFNTDPGTVSIGRMAVAQDFRGKGLGHQLLYKAIEEGVRIHNAEQFALSAQVHAIDFYAQFGFLITSEEYFEAGIAHRKMALFAPGCILSAYSTDQLAAHGHRPFVAGSDENYWPFFNDTLGNELATCCLNEDAHDIELFDFDLSSNLYRSRAFIDRLSSLARENRRVNIRILLASDQNLAKRSHPLIELAKRLSSKIALKMVDTDYPTEDVAYLLAGRYNLLYRNNPREIEGFCDFNRPDRVHSYRDKFDEMWKRARRTREFHTFGL